MKINRSWALIMGWLMIILIFVLSLMPISSQMPDIPNADKYGHLLAYGGVMFWFSQLYPTHGLRFFLACVFVLMGLFIEYLQGLTMYRSSEWLDALMNTAGVALGWLGAQIINLRRWIV